MAIKELIESLKTLGPIWGSALVGALIVAVPLVIKIDDRYAKDKVLQEKMSETNKRLEEQIGHLKIVNGQFQMLLTVMLPPKPSVALPVLDPATFVGPSVPAKAPAITPDEQAKIDALIPKEVVLQSVKNKSIETGEKLKSSLVELKKP